jgi:hypothetical protein
MSHIYFKSALKEVITFEVIPIMNHIKQFAAFTWDLKIAREVEGE